MTANKIIEKYSPNMKEADLVPTIEDFVHIIESKRGYEQSYGTPQGAAWQKKNFFKTPWGISWNVSPRGKAPNESKALRYYLVAELIGWAELITNLKRTVGQSYKWSKKDIETVANSVWKKNITDISQALKSAVIQLDAKSAAANNQVTENLEEDIEKHEELNPAIFNENSTLKSEIKEKITEIVDEFLKDFIEVEIDLKVEDIILTGSNASYNYTKDSDLDIHIIADTSEMEDTAHLYKVIYDAYKSAFNKKFDIELNKVPVEIYVETQDTPLVSNGIYSVMKDKWIKEPTKEDIPEVDTEAIEKAVKPWENRYKNLINRIDDTTEDESEIDEFITKLYELRHKGLAEDGEYSIGNLVFKEMRNKGYLDNLKELRHKVIANRLSLKENYKERLTEKERRDYYTKISQLTHYQPIVQPNGLFEIYNVKEVDLAVVLSNLRRQNEIEYVQQSAEKLDFSKINYHGTPSKLYKLAGKIKF